jgi:hypothetical protein
VLDDEGHQVADGIRSAGGDAVFLHLDVATRRTGNRLSKRPLPATASWILQSIMRASAAAR